MSSTGAALPGYMIFTDQTQQTVVQLRALLKTTPVKYLKKNGNPGVQEMTAKEKKSVDDVMDHDSRKFRRDETKTVYKNDLVIQALIEILAETKNVSIEDIQEQIDGIIATKLKL
jgi:hypothetical protein